jgi:glucose-6-phosphate isomerase
VDIQAFLDEAEEAAEILNEDSADNIGLALGSALGGTNPLRNKIVIAEDGSGIVGFADWAEQLIAESTGKLGTGLLPVVAGPESPEALNGAEDVLVVRLVGADADVEAAKVAARGLLDARPEPTPAAFTDGVVEVRGGDWLGSASTVAEAVQALLDQLGADGYLSVQAYLDRVSYAPLEGIRDELAAVSGRPVTFGWGPRFLHSTGQFHKGGPAIGVFLQVTAAASTDLEIPERPFTFGQLIAAQASGDAQVLEGHGRPVLRLHLTERAAGVAQLQDVVAALAGQASALES